MGLSSFLTVLHTSSASRGAAVAPQLLLYGSSSALGALPNSGPAVSQCRRPALAARPELCPAGGTELCALGRALPSFPHPERGASPLPTVTSVLPPQRGLYIPSPPPPIYPHGCSAVFPTNTRLSARSRGELPSRYLTAPPQRGGGGAHSAQGTDERPPLSHPPTSAHKQTTRRAGRENGRESYFFSYWLNCPSILSAPPLAARSALPIGLPSRHSGGSAGHAFRPPHPAFSLCVPCAKEKQPLNGPRGGASAAANKRRGDWRQRGVQISTGRSDWLGVAAAGRAPSSRSGGYCLAAPEAVRAADSGTGARAAAAPW